MKRILCLVMVLALIGGLAACTAIPGLGPAATPTPAAKKLKPQGATPQGYVTPVRYADLVFLTGGRVAQVLVAEGDAVKAGQPLVKLQDADLKAALALAQAGLARLQAPAQPDDLAAARANLDVAGAQMTAAEASLRQAQSGAQYRANMADAQTQLAQVQAQLKTVQDAYDAISSGRDLINEYRVYGARGGGLGLREAQLVVQLQAAKAMYQAAQKHLAQVQASYSDDLAAAQANLGIATGQRDAAQAQLGRLQAGASPAQIESAQAAVAQAQAALDEATLLAPFDGTIAELAVNVGDTVSPGIRVASIADLAHWYVETDDLSEVDAVNVKPGADATVSVDALPDVKMHGRVQSITPRSAVKRGDVTYTAYISITDPDPRLKWGMTAFADIPSATAAAETTASGKTESLASAQGYVTPVQHADLAFKSGGRIAQVLVAEGDVVKAGQPLVKLQDAALKAALMQAQADLKGLKAGARAEDIAAAQANLDVALHQVEVAQADLNRLQHGGQAAQLAAAQADAARAEADLKVAQDSYDALVTGHGVPTDAGNPSRGLGAYEEQVRARLAATRLAYEAAQKRLAQVMSSLKDDLSIAQANVDAAAGRRDAAQAQLNRLKAGAAPEEIQAAQARVDQAQAALDQATLTAPVDGTIAQLDAHPGEMAGPAIRIASIADLANWVIETDDLSETDVVNVQPGANVAVTLDALPGVSLRGRVQSITPRSAIKSGDVTYMVRITLADSDPRLRWGMTAFVDVLAK